MATDGYLRTKMSTHTDLCTKVSTYAEVCTKISTHGDLCIKMLGFGQDGYSFLHSHCFSVENCDLRVARQQPFPIEMMMNDG